MLQPFLIVEVNSVVSSRRTRENFYTGGLRQDVETVLRFALSCKSFYLTSNKWRPNIATHVPTRKILTKFSGAVLVDLISYIIEMLYTKVDEEFKDCHSTILICAPIKTT